MRTRTEDLLSLRDGGPIDAATRERLLADASAVQELQRLERVRAGLRELPPCEPPAQAWAAIEAACAAHRPRQTDGWRRVAGGSALAAGIAVVALWALSTQDDAREPPAATTASSIAGGVSSLDRPVLPVRYASLVEESARLERALTQLPGQRSLMSAATAGTIAGLEDHIAWLDEQITLAVAGGTAPEQRELLWSERVDMMNALLHLRYAQGVGF
jgi:predicted nucleic acid-binding protein